ncbi:MAG: hypothetical protein JWL70_286 [Acidimicrobiia bacterium]|nr:hypothetical protein [Acidimicrobiia bacterium]
MSLRVAEDATGDKEVPDADPDLPEIPDNFGPDGAGSTQPRLRRALRVVVPGLIAVAAVVVIASLAGDVGAMSKELYRVSPAVVAAAIACEAVSYALLGLHLRLLGGPADNVRRLAPFRVATIVFGLGSVMPAAPVEGIVMAGNALRHRRLSRQRTVLVLGVSQFFGTAGLYALAAIDAVVVVISAHDHPLAARGLLLGGGIGTLVVLVALAVVLTRERSAEWAAVAAGRLRHPRKPASADQRREVGAAWHQAAMHVLREGHKAPWLALTMVMAWGFDGSCLFLGLRAVGVHVTLDVLLLAYSVSAAASFIPFLPAGVGVVESIVPALLHLYGVPIESALAGMIVYRAVGTVLPAVVGAGSLVTLRLQSAPSETAAELQASLSTTPGEACSITGQALTLTPILSGGNRSAVAVSTEGP